MVKSWPIPLISDLKRKRVAATGAITKYLQVLEASTIEQIFLLSKMICFLLKR